MKITIDTNTKVVRLEVAMNLSEMVTELQKLLGDSWKEYSIDSTTVIENNLNTYVPYVPYPVWPIATPPYYSVGEVGLRTTSGGGSNYYYGNYSDQLQ